MLNWDCTLAWLYTTAQPNTTDYGDWTDHDIWTGNKCIYLRSLRVMVPISSWWSPLLYTLIISNQLTSLEVISMYVSHTFISILQIKNCIKRAIWFVLTARWQGDLKVMRQIDSFLSLEGALRKLFISQPPGWLVK